MPTIDKILNTQNIAELLDDDTLKSIGFDAVTGFKTDLTSRAEWEQNNAEALRAAQQITEDKTFPWQGAANVRFPLIALACVNFQSRAVSDALPSGKVVMCRGGMPIEHLQQEVSQQLQQAQLQMPIAQDPAQLQEQQQQLQQQAKQALMQMVMGQKKLMEQIGNHMTFQMQELDDFEDKLDLLLTILPLAGCVVKETYYDPELGRNTSTVILPNDFVLDYWSAGDIHEINRVSKRFYLFPNEIEAREREGRYIEGKFTQMTGMTDEQSDVRDDRQGMSSPRQEDAPVTMIEQHCWLDLDNDGYAEPYIITVDVDLAHVRRIVKRFSAQNVQRDGKRVVRITPKRYFTKYEFMKALDGGWYSQGFGSLLSSVNETVSSLLNRMLDAGTLAVTAGGFLSKEVRIKGGNYEFRPNEWKRADCSSQVLANGVLPLPVREPSNVLLQLFTYLVEYGERVAGAVDVTTGILPGQNTPAETSRNALEQGLKVYRGVMRRIYRAMAKEFRLWFELNKEHYQGGPFDMVPPGAYQATPVQVVFPAMNPNVMNDSARLTQAQAVLQAAMSAPLGMYNIYEVHKDYLEALKVSPDRLTYLLPDPMGPLAQPLQPPVPVQIQTAKSQAQIQTEQIKAQTKQAVEKGKMQLAIAKLLQEADMTKAKIDLLEAQARNQMAQAASSPVQTAVHAANTELAFMKAKHDGLLASIKLIHEIEGAQYDRGNNGGDMGEMAQSPGNEAVPRSTQDQVPASA